MPILLMLGLAVIAWPGPDDPKDAVSRLAAPRSAEREQAVAAVEHLGEAALPALREAADSSDLELRARAAAMLDEIEGRRLTRPTMVTLDFRTASLASVLSEIAKRTGATLLAEPPNDPRWRKPVTLQDGEPVALWETLDRLARAGGMRIDPGMNPLLRGRQVFVNAQGQRRRAMTGLEIVLRPEDGSVPAAPVSDSGAFRISILDLKLSRNRNFVRSPESLGQPEATAHFTMQLQARAEPRLTLASLDGPKILEARDDLGQSLVGETAQAVPTPPLQRGFDEMARATPLTVALKYPENPGRTIVILRGSLRALVVGRRDNPVVVPLGAGIEKVTGGDGASVLVHSVRPGADGRSATVEMTITPPGGDGAFTSIHNPSDPRAGLRPPPAARGHVEFFDAKGQRCQTIDLGALGMGTNPGIRTTLTIQSPEGTGPPTEARYYGATWASVEVPFTFRDVPMP